MFINLFKDIINNDCPELLACVKEDLGYELIDDLDTKILFSDDARKTYYQLNSPCSKTRNWLIINYNVTKPLEQANVS